jgi:hypothetical protein
MVFSFHDKAQRVTLAAIGLLFGLAVSIAVGHLRAPEQAVGVAAPVATRETRAPKGVAPIASTLPQPVLGALAQGKLVVLSFVLPGSQLDLLAGAEAQAAARSSKAAFFALDASGKAAPPLLQHYGLKSTPAVIVLAPPNRLTFRASMFLDAATIRQAIRDARR